MTNSAENWDPVLSALSLRPCGLLSDLDGTLSPIAPSPEGAVVEPEMTRVFGALNRKVDVVGVVTGRAPEDAARILGIGDIVYIGNHGMEDLLDGTIQPLPGTEPLLADVSRVLSEAEKGVSIPGVLFENKRVSGTVHYRMAEDKAKARAELLPLLLRLTEGTHLGVREGRMAFELRPKHDPGKGGAVERVIERYALRGCVFLGDDVTDTDGFNALRALRESTGIRTCAVGVVSEETPEIVREHADVLVSGTEGVLGLLQWLERNL